MKVFNIEQVKEIQTRQNYRYVGLFDAQGRAIIPFNTNKSKPADRLREIETRLLSEALPDGYYFVKCKMVIHKTGTTDDYAVLKGEKLSEPMPQPVIIEKPVYQPEVLTYESALKLQVECERLKLTNKALEEKIQQLENELTDIRVLSEGEEPEPAISWIEQLTQIAAPLLDKHFQLKEQQLALKAIELKSRIPAQAPQRSVKKPEDNKQKIETCILSFNDEPEKYERLAYFYNNALNQEAFIHNVKIEEPDLFNEFMDRYE